MATHSSAITYEIGQTLFNFVRDAISRKDKDKLSGLFFEVAFERVTQCILRRDIQRTDIQNIELGTERIVLTLNDSRTLVLIPDDNTSSA